MLGISDEADNGQNRPVRAVSSFELLLFLWNAEGVPARTICGNAVITRLSPNITTDVQKYWDVHRLFTNMVRNCTKTAPFW